jgi:hypothetical protein
MPWIEATEHPEFPAHYRLPRGLGLINNYTGGRDVLDKKRKEYATHLQLMKTYQQESGKIKDLDTAKFFKEEVRETQKNYYGICAALDYSGSNSGDCVNSLKNMTQEIAPYADHWLGIADSLLEWEQQRAMKEMGIL